MRARIVCLPGDGTGPEVMQEAVRVLTSVACAFDHSFAFVEEKLGRSALLAYGTPLNEKTLESCRAANAVLLGAAGLPAFSGTTKDGSKKDGHVMLQGGLGLTAGIQLSPIPQTAAATQNLTAGADLALVWPLPDGAADSFLEEEGQTAHDTISLTAPQAEEVMRTAFQLARERHRTIHTALEPGLHAAGSLWREAARHVGKEYPDISLTWLESGRCAAELARDPAQFDVLLAASPLHRTLSGILAGRFFSQGLSPCFMTGSHSPDVYLPAYADEPAQAGRDMISPIAMILAAALMLRRSLQLCSEADCVEMAVKNVLDAGWRTADMARSGEPKVGTQAIGKLIAEQVDTAGAIMGGFRR